MIIEPLLINSNFPQGEEMIKKACLTNHHYRDSVIDYIIKKNYKSVIDVGGAMNNWPDVVSEALHGRKIVTAYFDWNCHYLKGKTDALMFNGNMSNYWEWETLIEYVAYYGKFDFAICTQTLEDIRDPVTVLHMLPKIAHRGYIDVPSKYLELTRGCEADSMDPKKDVPEWGIHSAFYGYTGHRWVMNMIDNVLWLLPKLAWIEVLEGIDHLAPQLKTHEGGFLAFWWEDGIPYKVVGDDFLGPNPPACFNMYRECLNKGL